MLLWAQLALGNSQEKSTPCEKVSLRLSFSGQSGALLARTTNTARQAFAENEVRACSARCGFSALTSASQFPLLVFGGGGCSIL